jgi:hypothetical protein
LSRQFDDLIDIRRASDDHGIVRAADQGDARGGKRAAQRRDRWRGEDQVAQPIGAR